MVPANMRADAIVRRRIGAVLLATALTSAGIWLNPAQANAEGQPVEAAASKRQAPRHVTGRSLDDRVKLLTKELDLDANQQTEFRKLLLAQREQVLKVWADPTVPAAYRVSAVQSISDKTADQIRALLNDEQKKKYNPPKPPRDAAARSGPSVEDWLNKTKSK